MAQEGIVKLNTGAEMPLIGLDGNETEIGEVFAEVFGEGGAVKREAVFVTSKLWNSEHAPENVKPACVQTLKDLQLEYLDLYLIHWPQNFEKVEGTHKAFPRNEDGSIRYDMETTSAQTWAAMEALVAEGLVKAIGLSNFNSGQIEAIIEAGTICPAVLQVEIHPYFSQEPLVAFCKERGIVPTAYSPLGTGQAINGQTVVGNETLAEVGATYGKSSAQVAIAWLAQRGIVVIPKSVTAARIAQNREVGFVLSDEDMAKVSALNADARNGWGGPKVERGGGMEPRDLLHPLYPFRPGIAF